MNNVRKPIDQSQSTTAHISVSKTGNGIDWMWSSGKLKPFASILPFKYQNKTFNFSHAHCAPNSFRFVTLLINFPELSIRRVYLFLLLVFKFIFGSHKVNANSARQLRRIFSTYSDICVSGWMLFLVYALWIDSFTFYYKYRGDIWFDRIRLRSYIVTTTLIWWKTTAIRHTYNWMAFYVKKATLICRTSNIDISHLSYSAENRIWSGVTQTSDSWKSQWFKWKKRKFLEFAVEIAVELTCARIRCTRPGEWDRYAS